METHTMYTSEIFFQILNLRKIKRCTYKLITKHKQIGGPLARIHDTTSQVTSALFPPASLIAPLRHPYY